MRRGGRGGRPGAVSFRKTQFKPIDTYTYNPNCESETTLSEVERELIIYNRLLKNYLNTSLDFVKPPPPPPVIESFSGGEIKDSLTEQRNSIVQAVGPEYFPADLLANRLDTTTIVWKGNKAKGSALASAGLTTTNTPGDADEEDEVDEEEDFGGEDYGVDHYAEEDAEDEFLDNAGGAGEDFD